MDLIYQNYPVKKKKKIMPHGHLIEWIRHWSIFWREIDELL